tara:strand:+ start:37 stop:1146 length:1110 start_codon:yes stop_codon:yes gene_type:complete
MKVLVLHPPMYPVNYDFYNYLGEYVDLTIFQFGEHPVHHKHWHSDNLKGLARNFQLKVFGKGPVTFKNVLFSLKFKEVKDLSPDIVLSIAFWLPSLYFSLLSIIMKFKFVILTNAIIETEKNNSVIKHLFRKIICKNTIFIVSASELTNDYLERLVEQDKIRLSVQTIDIDCWRNDILSLKTKKQLRQELEIPINVNVILGVGNFIKKKNWLCIMKSLRNLDDVLFILIGRGSDLMEYRSYIKQHDLETKVLILDVIQGTELKKYYKLSDLFILPSLYDQFGFVVPEALASGLPVICSKNTGASCLINNGINGYVFDPDEFILDELIINTIDNLEYFQDNAYESIKHKELEYRAKQFYNIFKEAIGRNL